MKHSVINMFILLAIITIFLPSNGLCDTGTYKIQEYTVTLTPHNNGYADIDYYQKWKVTGGNIPWITVGLPNSGFAIVHEKTGKNISQIQPGNSRGWSGVKIILDKKYMAGETFEVKFTVSQNGLFYARGEKYRLDFIPGWYDRAKINRMAITLEFSAGLENVTAKPAPDRVDTNTFLWERNRLKKGAKVHVSMDFPKSFFSENIYLAKKPSKAGSPGFIFNILMVLFIVIIIAFIIVISSASGKNKYGSGGRIRTGGTRAGVHRPGCVVSCACACVSCACACACAGGGAAGCDRKLTLTCPLCKECRLDDCPVRNEKGTMRTLMNRDTGKELTT